MIYSKKLIATFANKVIGVICANINPLSSRR